MRKELGKNIQQRLTFTARVERFGSKTNYHGYLEDTILLTDVRFQETNELATDHIWFTVGKTISKLNLTEGDVVRFNARVSEYVKGYVNRREYIDERRTDYKLNNPTKFEKLVQNVK